MADHFLVRLRLLLLPSLLLGLSFIVVLDHEALTDSVFDVIALWSVAPLNGPVTVRIMSPFDTQSLENQSVANSSQYVKQHS